VTTVIDQNFESGMKNGVSGTPAYFINGRKLSGALPYEYFQKVFEEELKKKR
jgi:protein-disulfide isomerase